MDILTLLGSLNIPFKQKGEHHHVTEGWVSIDCPYCSPKSNRFRFGIELSSGRTNCWVCGFYPLYQTLQLISGSRIKPLLKGIKFKRSKDLRPQGTYTPPKGLTDLKSRHRRYLKSRGFDPDHLIKLWKIQGLGLGKLGWRIFIPVELDGKPVTWTSRSLSDRSSSRYLTSPSTSESIPIKDTLYGIDLVRGSVIVCEGPTDVWRIGPGAVCTFGTAISKSQITQIGRFARRVICFDNELKAQRNADRLVSTLSALPGETINVTLNSDDPASATNEEIDELRGLL